MSTTLSTRTRIPRCQQPGCAAAPCPLAAPAAWRVSFQTTRNDSCPCSYATAATVTSLHGLCKPRKCQAEVSQPRNSSLFAQQSIGLAALAEDYQGPACAADHAVGWAASSQRSGRLGVRTADKRLDGLCSVQRQVIGTDRRKGSGTGGFMQPACSSGPRRASIAKP